MEQQNYKLIDHPADNYVDYNSMVDNLEEEHMRRDVFTTAIETTNGQVNINPAISEADLIFGSCNKATVKFSEVIESKGGH